MREKRELRVDGWRSDNGGGVSSTTMEGVSWKRTRGHVEGLAVRGVVVIGGRRSKGRHASWWFRRTRVQKKRERGDPAKVVPAIVMHALTNHINHANLISIGEMESGRRVLESYRRWRMIDGATSDEDKVTPVYKLEEICVLLSSHVSIVKEISGFIFKRLQHKSPIVKQKALRVIKHVVGKSGAEFRREMQKNSVAVRQLIHYKGHPDPLKGDALNKSLRETAQEALSAIFSGQDNNNAPLAEGLAQRIQGFGNTNFDMPPDGRKSFFREVVDIGSATVKHGLGSLTQAQTQTKNDTGTYTSQILHGALTTEISYSGSNGRYSEVLPSGLSTNVSGPWGQDPKTSQVDATNRSSSSFHSHDKTREERLLETIVTSGGVRLQPTREARQIFLIEALKLNALALSQALEAKLQSHMWQVEADENPTEAKKDGTDDNVECCRAELQ